MAAPNVEIRELSGRILREARDARATQSIRKVVELGDAFKALRDIQAEAFRDPAALPTPGDSYDVDVLLHAAIVGWSYPEPVTTENIDDLDETTEQVVIEALLMRGGGEEDRKNGSQLSIVGNRAEG